MLALRFYIDKKISSKTKRGGEHSRVIDVGELDEDKARVIVERELGKDEEIGGVASINIDDPDTHPVLT